jgi:quinol-cytochrome oxidoreductase complex cytochrome b subunit
VSECVKKFFSFFIREEKCISYITLVCFIARRGFARAREREKKREKARRRADASEFNPLVFLSRVFFFFVVFFVFFVFVFFLFENDERRWNEVDED